MAEIKAGDIVRMDLPGDRDPLTVVRVRGFEAMLRDTSGNYCNDFWAQLFNLKHHHQDSGNG